jgi:hypothetical protein
MQAVHCFLGVGKGDEGVRGRRRVADTEAAPPADFGVVRVRDSYSPALPSPGNIAPFRMSRTVLHTRGRACSQVLRATRPRRIGTVLYFPILINVPFRYIPARHFQALISRA